MKITINTGRLYQTDGQRVTFEWQEDGSVIFDDHSRGIVGRVAPGIEPIDAEDMARQAMRAYDRGAYRMEIRGLRPSDAVKPMRM